MNGGYATDCSPLIDAIIGRGFQSTDEAARMVTLGLARFSGNQWNEGWTWDREALSKKSYAALNRFYHKGLW